MGVGREQSKKYKEKGGELKNSRMCECNMCVAENYNYTQRDFIQIRDGRTEK